MGLPFNPVSQIRRPAPGAGRNRRLTPTENKCLLAAVDTVLESDLQLDRTDRLGNGDAAVRDRRTTPWSGGSVEAGCTAGHHEELIVPDCTADESRYGSVSGRD